MIARLARTAGVALDARTLRGHDPAEQALAAGWIAANLLAARGVKIAHDGDAPFDAKLIAVRATDLAGLLAAIATAPALIDPTTIPARWRFSLRALGVPLLDLPIARALAAGASVAQLTPVRRERRGGCTISVGADAEGYRVRLPRLLVG